MKKVKLLMRQAVEMISDPKSRDQIEFEVYILVHIRNSISLLFKEGAMSDDHT